MSGGRFPGSRLVWGPLLLLAGCSSGAGVQFPALSDPDWEELSIQVSEPPGYFDTDNLISNEAAYQQIIPALRRLAKPGGAYIGVGPDQNFTYIAQLRPAIAFIIDIRRDNLLQHLYFKEIFRTAASRVEYLSQLFGKPLAGRSTSSRSPTAVGLARTFRSLPSDEAFFNHNLERLWSHLRSLYPRLLGEQDRLVVRNIARAFFDENLDLRFRSHGRAPRAYYPTFQDLMTVTDLEGKRHNYLDSEDDYELVRRMEVENRIIPVVGDLAGRKALRRIGNYLTRKGLVVSAFYLSNVEFYLFRNRSFDLFVANAAQLPIDSGSVFIRTYFNHWRVHPEAVPGFVVTPLLQSIERFQEINDERPYLSYWALVSRDYLPSETRLRSLQSR
ncbi:MAG: hypothetical protein ACE5JX_17590 [Acidobacteriota bacterium]